MRIGVWNTAFLGDAALTLPLLQSLRMRFPDAILDYYVRSGLEDLFISHPAINSVYGYAKNSGGIASILKTGKEIRNRGYDLWICAHRSIRSALIARLGAGRERIGYDRPFVNKFFYTNVVKRRFNELEEIDRLLALLHPLGERPVSIWPEIWLNAKAREKADKYFADIKGPVLGLHPGAVWASKRWPAEFYAEIGKRALAHGAYVLLFAGKGEEELTERVLKTILNDSNHPDYEEEKRLRNLAGTLSLPELAAFLARLACYVTNDSGPMHLAWAQKVPLTAIFGPTARSLGFYPRGKDSKVIETRLACRPCGLHGHRICPLGHHHCMMLIHPDMVWDDVKVKLLH
jgi:heptosyltransferase-2